MKAFFVCFVSVLLSAHSASGCTVTGKTFSVFDETEYVFIGTVIGYTAPQALDRNRATESVEPLSQTYLDPATKTIPSASGLILNVKEKIYLPKVTAEFEVFPIGLMADCSARGANLSELKHDYPLNSEVRVIAKEAHLIAGRKSVRIRLEDRPDESGQIVVNSDKTSTKLTTSTSEFDYKSYTHDVNKEYSYYSLPNFELRKDLLRLKRVSSARELNSILDRLFFAPENVDADLRGIFDRYASSPAEAKRYFETRLKARDPEGYVLHLQYEKLVSNLMKLGYDRTIVENAIQTTFLEGTTIDSKDFIEKCAAVLARRKPKPQK